MTEGSEFESWETLEFSLFHTVQTGSGAHPPANPLGIKDSLRGFKVVRALN
jgi:hypothetical protein